MLRLYDYLSSGNGYKVRLLLAQLGLPFERIDLDIMKGETRTEAFLGKNPNGRIPTIELEDGTCLSESDAILFYLAEGTPLLPDDRLERAQVLQWMFFEQYSHEPFVAVARFWRMHGDMTEVQRALLPQKMDGGYAALGVMENRLTDRDFLVGRGRGAYSIADMALYAYTHVAHEGGFDLARFPAVRAWLDRISQQRNYIPITKG